MPTHTINNLNRKLRVAIFQWVVPAYRVPIFNALQQNEDMEFEICYPQKKGNGEFGTSTHGIHFPQRLIKLFQIKIPIINKIVTWQPQAVAALIKKDYDFIIMSSDISDISLWVNLILAKVLGRKIGIWGHCTVKRFVRITRIVRKIQMALANAVIFYSEGIREYWADSGVNRNKLFVAYNSLDTAESFRIQKEMTAAELEAFQKEKGINGKFVILFMGRLFPRKRFDMLVRSVARIRQQHPNVCAVIIGDGPEKNKIISLARELDVSDHIIMPGAIYDEKENAKYLMSSRVMVIPIQAGLAIQHAFAYGLPVITARGAESHGPEYELLQDGVTALLYDFHVEDALTKTILRLIENESLRKKMGESAVDIIKNKYNLDNMVEGFRQAVHYATGTSEI